MHDSQDPRADVRTIHVAPPPADHVESTDCPCSPIVRELERGIVVVTHRLVDVDDFTAWRKEEL